MCFGPLSWAIAHAPGRFSIVRPIFERHPGCAKHPFWTAFVGYSTRSRLIFNSVVNFRASSQMCKNVHFRPF
jgi:hypothetical protein